MNDPMTTITVYGTPAPQGSKRHVGRGIMIESSKKVKPWREAVVWAVREIRKCKKPISGPVLVSVSFYFQRPKSLPRRIVWHAKRPDLDKLVRSTFDGIVQAGWILDDSQIYAFSAVKYYTSDQSHAQITVTEEATEA